MEIVRPKKDSGIGIYAKSIKVKPKKHRAVAKELLEWFEKTNGTFEGEHSKAFGIAHCQVANIEEPLNLMVLTSDLVNPKAALTAPKGAQTRTNVFFESQLIWNAVILESPERITRKVPKRNVGKPMNGKVDVDIVMEDRKLSNVIRVPEACMSWKHRKPRNKDRYHTVKVRYQYIVKIWGFRFVRTFEGWVEGLKAHVLQHECEHFEGKNMYYD